MGINWKHQADVQCTWTTTTSLASVTLRMFFVCFCFFTFTVNISVSILILKPRFRPFVWAKRTSSQWRTWSLWPPRQEFFLTRKLLSVCTSLPGWWAPQTGMMKMMMTMTYYRGLSVLTQEHVIFLGTKMTNMSTISRKGRKRVSSMFINSLTP